MSRRVLDRQARSGSAGFAYVAWRGSARVQDLDRLGSLRLEARRAGVQGQGRRSNAILGQLARSVAATRGCAYSLHGWKVAQILREHRMG